VEMDACHFSVFTKMSGQGQMAVMEDAEVILFFMVCTLLSLAFMKIVKKESVKLVTVVKINNGKHC